MESAALKIQKVFRRHRHLRLYLLSWSYELQRQVCEICLHLNNSNKYVETYVGFECLDLVFEEGRFFDHNQQIFWKIRRKN